MLFVLFISMNNGYFDDLQKNIFFNSNFFGKLFEFKENNKNLSQRSVFEFNFNFNDASFIE